MKPEYVCTHMLNDYLFWSLISWFFYMGKVRSQDAVFGLAVGQEGREVTWTWLKVNNTTSSYMKCKMHCLKWIIV